MQLSALTSALRRFVSELQRRKVIRVAAGYAVVGWIVLQVAVALEASLNLPAWFDTVVVSSLALGFPVALIAAWLFDFTSEGIKRTVSSGDAPLVKPQTTDLALAGALALVLIMALVQLFTSSPTAPTTTAEATPAKPEPPALGDKSIAVLPFANLSPEKEDAFLADGLTEEVLNVLAQMRGLRLISRTSSFAFKGKNTPLPEIAKQLGVRHVLEGSVRRDGEDIRITAQLIDVMSDTHLWSATFERKAKNVFAVQDQIARAIANALDVELAASASSNGAPTSDMEAYRLYLEARELFRLRRKLEDLTNSVALYKRAIELDPEFAEAYAGLALSYSAIMVTNTAELERLAPLSRAAAETAIKIKPSLAQPHAMLGTLDRLRLDWEGSRAHTSKALSLDPLDSLAIYTQGSLEIWTGYLEEASRTISKAQRVDPLYAFAQTGAAQVAFARGDDFTCLNIANKLARSESLYGRAGHFYLAYYARLQGKPEEAEKHYRAWEKLRGGKPLERVVAALKSASALPAALKAIDEAREENLTASLLPLLMIGAQDEFLDALNSETLHLNSAGILGAFPYAWRTVATHGANPKFKTLMRNAGLVDYWKKHGWPDRCRAKGEDDFECS